MGLTFLAAGTSVPDLITSVLVAKEGKVTLMMIMMVVVILMMMMMMVVVVTLMMVVVTLSMVKFGSADSLLPNWFKSV